VWHAQVVKQALAAGKHVLEEKPIGPTLPDALELLQQYRALYAGKPATFARVRHHEIVGAAGSAAQIVKRCNPPGWPVLSSAAVCASCSSTASCETLSLRHGS
jgi:hypothetical protein